MDQQTFTSESMYYKLTDGDMSYHEYMSCIPMQMEVCDSPNVVQYSSYNVLYEVSSNTCIKQLVDRPCISERHIKLHCKRYVRFTKTQILYLRSIFKKNNKPKVCDDILLVLHQLSYPGQLLTEKKILSFFKNERHRNAYISS